MKTFSAFRKKIIVLGIIVTLIFSMGGCGFHEKSDTEELETIDYEEKNEDTVEEVEIQYISVYVCGAVNEPGVYELEEAARVCEAIQAAGGFREDAAKEYLNQARIIVDGERISVPTEEEAAELGPEVIGTASSQDGKININTATKEELEQLNGIGESRAESILQYRQQNGDFSSVEDLKNVDGIKDGVFEKIKDNIIA